ncbi:MAG TPA: homocysteine S-methyltransferase family protein [Patescibacteria group bacterium]|nr:homocysteine S-methyltransferase family protein [Patescibacteria group bacterium]
MKSGIVEKLKNGIVLGAEGYLFELERRGYLKAGAFVPEVVLDHPHAVEELHREFLRAGAEVMVAFTYYAHREKLKVIGREKDLEPMNRHALQIAKKIAKEGSALVAGNICNTWAYNPARHKETSKIVRDMYREQVQWAKEEGADFIIAETIEYVGEALIALEVIKEFGFPALVTFGATYEKSKDNVDWIEGCKLLEKNGADIVGFNCIRGPKTMLPLLEKLRQEVNCFIAAQPVPYRTTKKQPAFQFLKQSDDSLAFPTNLDPHLCTRSELADFALKAQEIGVNYIGICCGAGPHHVRSMAESLGRIVASSRYSPDMSQHGLLGNKKVVKQHERQYLDLWK